MLLDQNLRPIMVKTLAQGHKGNLVADLDINSRSYCRPLLMFFLLHDRVMRYLLFTWCTASLFSLKDLPKSRLWNYSIRELIAKIKQTLKLG